MHESDCANELREVDMRNIFRNTSICFDLVEKISSLSQLHGNPSPYFIFTTEVKLYNMFVYADMFV